MSGRILSDTVWRNAEGLRQVVSALHDNRGGPRFVGGAVRDTLLGIDVTDVDLATALLPETVIDRLEAARIRALPTGIEHGTITAVAGGKNYEITTLRRDVATDGRRAVVAFSTDWKEDAVRRDFTINALYADPATGEIFDYFGGLEDLDAGIIRFIGDADQRIAEDYLRVLRYFRFLARFGRAQIDVEAIRACAAGAHGLTALSRERIAQELVKIMSLANPVKAVELMIKHAIFSPFLPELRDDAAYVLRRLVEREMQFKRDVSLPARLLTLLPTSAVIADRIASRLKLSNRLREALAMRLNAPAPTRSNIRALAYRAGQDCAYDVVMLWAEGSKLPDCLVMLDGWTVPKFAIKGGDLIARGLTAGPLVAKTLKRLETNWVAGDFPPQKRLDEMADQMVSDALLAARKS